MPDERSPTRSIRDDAGDIVGVAVFVLLLVNVGLTAALTWVFENFGLRAGVLDWAYFFSIYLKTFPLSVTLTMALTIYAVGRMYGRRVPWIALPLILVAGAVATAAINGTPWNPFQGIEFESPWVILFKVTGNALLVFAWLFGPEFLSGTITGVAGGLISIAAAHRRLTSALGSPENPADPLRRTRYPWVGGVVALIVAVAALSFLFVTDMPELWSPVR